MKLQVESTTERHETAEKTEKTANHSLIVLEQGIEAQLFYRYNKCNT